MNIFRRGQTGFTIVELLIVIVVIGILAALVLNSFSGAQARARDARRAQDIASIKRALLAYEALNGGVPRTTGASSYTQGVIYQGWDASTSPNWLAFLRANHGNNPMPVDPTNNVVGNNPPIAGNRVYYYFCYDPTATRPESMVILGYHKEENNQPTATSFTVAACL